MVGGVLVLAAGKSTRITPLSGGLPKPLLDFGGKRLIEWTLEWLQAAGHREVWINLHYRAESVRGALGDGSRYGLRLNYVYEPELLGTAGAWRNVAGSWEGTSLVVYGDNVIRFGLEGLRSAHRSTGALVTVVLFDPAHHRHTGIAGGRVVLGGDGRILEFREGGPARSGVREYVNAGVYLVEPEVRYLIPAGAQDFGRDLFPRLLAEGRLMGYVMEETGFCLGLDTPASFTEGERMLSAGEVELI